MSVLGPFEFKIAVSSFEDYLFGSTEAKVMSKEKAIEAAARALCRLAGIPENTRFEGEPMWQSYLAEATAAIEAAIPHLVGG